MRFSIFVTLLVATFIARTCVVNAEKAVTDNAVRRLKGSKLAVDEEERAVNLFGNVNRGTNVLADNLNQFDNAVKSRLSWFYSLGKSGGKMKGAAKIIPKQEAQITKVVTKAAKQKVPWSETKKIIVGLDGATLGAAGLYALYKVFVSNGGTA